MCMTEAKWSFEFRNRLDELDALGRRVEAFGQRFGWSKKQIFQINFALEEVLTNIISYGYDDQAEHVIRVTVAQEDERITMRVEDDGIPFNPVEAPRPELECPVSLRKIGGLGIFLTKHMMDDVHYVRTAEHNILTLIKSRKNHHVSD